MNGDGKGKMPSVQAAKIWNMDLPHDFVWLFLMLQNVIEGMRFGLNDVTFCLHIMFGIKQIKTTSVVINRPRLQEGREIV